ncbi:MAG TPA: TlpA disulfide reductase family protein [Methylomirabilota bacterium]|nr:TlpA disulfide reductase family protein [Methylomirabilota bacterium]
MNDQECEERRPRVGGQSLFAGGLALASFFALLCGLVGSAPAEEPDQAPLQILEPRRKVPDFSLQDLDGKTVTLKEFRGKVVFLNFWATWCPPCREEMPAMQKIYTELQDKGLVMLAVNFMETPNTIRPFVKEHKLTFPILLDSGTVMVSFGVLGLPATYLIDRQGKAAARALGGRDWSNQESLRMIRKLLDER